MALALMLRGAARPDAFRSALRLTTIQLKKPTLVKQTVNLTQFTTHGLNAIALGRTNNLLPKFNNIQVRKAHIDHGLLWTVERVWAISLLGIIPLAVLSPSTLMDDVFAVSVVIHNHWGLEATVIDYVRPVIFGQTIPKLAILLLYGFSAALLGSILYFNHNDIGIGQTIQNFWHIRDKK